MTTPTNFYGIKLMFQLLITILLGYAMVSWGKADGKVAIGIHKIHVFHILYTENLLQSLPARHKIAEEVSDDFCSSTVDNKHLVSKCAVQQEDSSTSHLPR